MEAQKISMKTMCEKIVESNLLQKKDGSSPTAEEIFNYSLAGELFMIFEWYKLALLILKTKKITP